tara:strand:+ start:4279 stop:5130 length:852 start_codon:yes stop_codon:yes gene_type:complete
MLNSIQKIKNFTIVNAFTEHKLQGNQVAVFHDSLPCIDEELQSIAKVMQFSECTFFQSPGTSKNVPIKIFTPVNELSCAGHPLIGSAASFYDQYKISQFTFVTKQQKVQAQVTQKKGNHYYIELEYQLPERRAFHLEDVLKDSLRLDHIEMPIEAYNAGANHILVAVSDKETLHKIKPNYSLLEQFSDTAINCFYWDGQTVENRMFSPAYGVIEDAGTGSAVCPILMHLIRHKNIDPTQKIRVLQGVLLERESVMYGQLDKDENTFILSGNAYLFAHGKVSED